MKHIKKLNAFILALVLVFSPLTGRRYIVEAQRSTETENTFKSDGHEYTAQYILSKYSALTFGDVAVNQLVGLGIINGDLYPDLEQNIQNLFESNITNVINKNDKFVASIRWHYNLLSDYKNKNLYVKGYFKALGYFNIEADHYFGKSNHKELNPSNNPSKFFINSNLFNYDNNFGVYKTDDYIDIDKAYNALNQESYSLFNHFKNRVLNAGNIETATFLDKEVKIINVRPGERVMADLFFDQDLIVINYEKSGAFEAFNLLYAIDELKSYNDIIGWHIGNPNAEGKAYLNIFHNMPYATHVYHPNGADHTNSTIANWTFLRT